MAAIAPTRFLDPSVLAGISSLDLVAKSVVQGFVAGLHRSPDFGFSQEFAEYRAYTPGDDLRHIDWNVFARAERMYLKRYRGETNTEVTVLLDVSASMGFASGPVRKLEYAKFLAAALVYLAHLQRDSAGLIVFHGEVTEFVRPSSRQGQLARLLHAIEAATLGKKTDFAIPVDQLQQFLKRKGIVILISDFFEKPETVVQTVEPLCFRGNELALLQVLDPAEIEPKLSDAVLLVDMETGETIETNSDYGRSEYQELVQAHLKSMAEKAQGAGIDHFLLRTDQPLDAALRQYLAIRQRRF